MQRIPQTHYIVKIFTQYQSLSSSFTHTNFCDVLAFLRGFYWNFINSRLNSVNEVSPIKITIFDIFTSQTFHITYLQLCHEEANKRKTGQQHLPPATKQAFISTFALLQFPLIIMNAHKFTSRTLYFSLDVIKYYESTGDNV